MNMRVGVFEVTPVAVACSLVGFTHNGAINPLMQMPEAMLLRGG